MVIHNINMASNHNDVNRAVLDRGLDIHISFSKLSMNQEFFAAFYIFTHQLFQNQYYYFNGNVFSDRFCYPTAAMVQLTHEIFQQFHMTSSLAEYKDLSPQKLQNIERSMLPVLLCAYAKNGNTKSIKQLLEYGASPNSRLEFTYQVR